MLRDIVYTLSFKQQQSRLSNVLDSIKVLAELENISEIKIAALALQLVSNEYDTRQVAKVSKLIVTDNFPGDFGKVVKKDVDVDKSLFLLDMLEIGKRKYTKLRQHLLSIYIQFPAYQKLVDRRNSIILRSSIKLYPNVLEPIGACVSYAQFVEHTFTRILSTISRPLVEDFPLSYQIVDGLDGSGSHTIYNQQNANTSTKSLIFFASNPFSSSLQVETNSGKILPLTLHFVNGQSFYALLKKMSQISENL